MEEENYVPVNLIITSVEILILYPSLKEKADANNKICYLRKKHKVVGKLTIYILSADTGISVKELDMTITKGRKINRKENPPAAQPPLRIPPAPHQTKFPS